MRILIISDIHSNLEAIQAVVNNTGEVDAVWCLGDLVGYGPDPDECIDLIKSLPNLSCIRGNHDAAILGEMDVRLFNQEARSTIDWQLSHLSTENIEFLKKLPDRLSISDCYLVHGSPRYPIWEYILDPFVARVNFDFFNEDYCFVGHSHQPLMCHWNPINEKINWNDQLNGQVNNLKPRTIINPGSVGQPRDNDPRASYGIFDDETKKWTLYRIDYPFQITQQKITENNLPEKNARRLAGGW
ncbi:MAG TPA: metallophosphoesterase family protein [Anaerolineaceae bacterium]|nr:metallophosphoesterase family protein [Anaerolineaceae bacterium]